MNGALKLIVAFVGLVLMGAAPGALAQRRVNPVKNSPALQGKNENKQEGDSIDYSKLVRHVDDKGNAFFVDTVTGREIPDTLSAPDAVGRVPKMLQPLLFATAVSVDVW